MRRPCTGSHATFRSSKRGMLEKRGAAPPPVFPSEMNFPSLAPEQYALFRGVETSHEWNVASHFW